MTIDLIKTVLLWCLILNYAFVTVWFLAFMLAHEWMYRMHSRWFKLTREQFDAIHYASLAAYKVGILLFNLVPYLALLIAGKSGLAGP